MPPRNPSEDDDLPPGAVDQRRGDGEPTGTERGGDSRTSRRDGESARDEESRARPAGDTDKTRPVSDEDAGERREGDDPGDEDDSELQKARVERQRKNRTQKELARVRRELDELRAGQQQIIVSEVDRRYAAEIARLDGIVQASELEHEDATEPKEQRAALTKLLKAEQARDAIAAQREQFARRSQQDAPAPRDYQEQADDDDPVAELRDGWVAKNRWFQKADPAEQAVVRLASERIGAKIPPDDPRHFAELDKELQRRLPERYPARANGNTAGRSSVMAAGGRSTAPAGRDPDAPTEKQLTQWAENGVDVNNKELVARLVGRANAARARLENK